MRTPGVVPTVMNLRSAERPRHPAPIPRTDTTGTEPSGHEERNATPARSALWPAPCRSLRALCVSLQRYSGPRPEKQGTPVVRVRAVATKTSGTQAVRACACPGRLPWPGLSEGHRQPRRAGPIRAVPGTKQTTEEPESPPPPSVCSAAHASRSRDGGSVSTVITSVTLDGWRT
jgi:hypothetical protein